MKLLLVIYLVLSISPCFSKNEIYVSPHGKDNNKGTKEEPLLTLQQARDRIRAMRKLPDGGVTVYLRGGLYELNATFVLGPEDSGREGSPIRYCAYPGEQPVLSGGEKIVGWKPLEVEYPEVSNRAKGKMWVAHIQKGRKFHFLYIDGKPAQRSRSVNDDVWHNWPKDYTFGEPESAGQLMTFKNPDELKNLPSNGDLEMMVILRQYGVIGNGVVTDIDTQKGTARWNSTQLNLRSSRIQSERAYRFENALALIDEPGEWAVNTERGEVYYWPIDKNIENAEIIAPTLNELIRFQGNEDEEKWVHDIEIRGLTMLYTDRLAEDKWPNNWLMRQWENPDAMVFIQGAHDCLLEGNTLLHSGSYGIALDHYAQRINIAGNEIGFTGSGGIQLYGYGPGTKDVNRNNSIIRNYIHDHGLANYWHSPGIQILGSGSNQIGYNFLERSAYSSISLVGINPQTLNTYAPKGSFVGQVDAWNQGNIRWEDFPKEILAKVKKGENPFNNDNFFEYMHSDSNIIEFNICNEPHAKLFEGGAIYAWHPGIGNVVNKNLIYKSSSMHGSSVIALDDRAEYFHIEGNVIWVNGVILDVIGMRDYTRGVIMKDNFRVAWKPEYNEGRKRPADWYTNTKEIQPFWNLYREIRNGVVKHGGWPGKPVLEVLNNTKISAPAITDVNAGKIIPLIGEGE